MKRPDFSGSVTTSNHADKMKKKLSAALQAAIKAYIDHRDNQMNVKWNKEQDCETIETVAFADGFARCEQCCGTWWFSVRDTAGVWVFECDESNYTTELTGVNQNVSSNALFTLGLLPAEA